MDEFRNTKQRFAFQENRPRNIGRTESNQNKQRRKSVIVGCTKGVKTILETANRFVLIRSVYFALQNSPCSEDQNIQRTNKAFQ